MKITKRPTFEAFKETALKDPEAKEAYEALRPEFELLVEFIKARKAANMSQEDLAKKLGVQLSYIVRLESRGYTKTSVANLTKIANALDHSLKISLKKKKS